MSGAAGPPRGAAWDPDRANTFVGEAVGLTDAIEPASAVIERMTTRAVALLGYG